MEVYVLVVKPIMDVVVVMKKIDALPDPLVPLAQLVPMENTVPKEGKAKLDNKVPVKDTLVHQDHLDANNAHPDQKDRTALPDPLDLLDPKDNQVLEVEMDVPAITIPAQLALPALQDRTVTQVLVVIMVLMAKMVAKALQAVEVKTAAPVPLALEETTVQLVIPANPELKVLLARLVDLAIRPAKVNLVQLVDPAALARMPNIVLARIVPKLKLNWNHPKFQLEPTTKNIILRFSMLTTKFSII